MLFWFICNTTASAKKPQHEGQTITEKKKTKIINRKLKKIGL